MRTHKEIQEKMKNDIWSVIDIETTPIIYNSETKEQLTLQEAIVELLNRMN